MNRIKLLDKSIAARIAAGEVIVNPAAVVKELIENAVDAGATAITVELQEGGNSLIRVTDNGTGIHADDIGLAIQKHATSKVRELADLNGIATLGFRGEALSSMAAVSRLTISSRVHSAANGAVLTVNGGSEPTIQPAGLPDGTAIKVENLFYNIPARKKFLKNAGTEASRVTSMVAKLIISNADIAVKYISNGKVIYQSPGHGQLLDTLISVYGVDIVEKTTEVTCASGIVAISGYISKPHMLYKNAGNILFYLNGRYIQSKKLQEALMNGYGERLMKSRFPFAVLNIRLPYDQADVNVHPGKLQVMLYNEEMVMNAITSCIRDTLETTSATTVIQPLSVTPPETPRMEEKIATSPHTNTKFALDSTDHLQSRPLKAGHSTASVMRPNTNDHMFDDGFEEVMDEIISAHAPKQSPVQQEIEDIRTLHAYTVIGQAFQTYVICECGDVLYLIDQHAAHERLNYEMMKVQIEQNSALSQRLLSSVLLKLNQADFDTASQNLELLNQIGFDIEEFGPLTLKVSAVPIHMGDSSVEKLLDDVIYELRKGTGDIMIARDRIIKAACRHSIKAGDALSQEELKHIIQELTTMEAIPVCPHGRPIAVALTKSGLQKEFKRTL